MTMNRSLALALCMGTLAAAAPAAAAEFVIDAEGSRPRKFRITLRCAGVDTWFSPDVYKSGLFNRDGKDIKATPQPSWRLGRQDGKLLLLEETEWGSDEYWVVGDATDLDRVRLLDDVEVTGHTEWDMGSIAWRVGSNTRGLGGLARFQGELLDAAWATGEAIADAAARDRLSESNREVLRTVLSAQWWRLIDANDDDHDAAHFLAKARATYLDPVREAARGADAAGRARLKALNAGQLEAAEEVRAYYRKDTWRPPVYDQTFDLVVEALQALQGEL